MKTQKKVTISQVLVRDLFGLFNYAIPKDKNTKISEVLIIYGDNGSGKTTLLRLIFHLLACEVSEGHKTFVACTKFREVKIFFSNGYTLRAYRKSESLIGSFLMELANANDLISKTEFIADSENSVKSGGPKDKENKEFLEAVEALNLSMYLLGDDRTVQITSPKSLRRYFSRGIRSEETFYERALGHFTIRAPEDIGPEQISIRLLEDSLRRLRAWMRDHAFRSSTRGESDVYEIFSDIVENIAGETPKAVRRKATRREHLVERIKGIERRNRDFHTYGLTPTFRGQKLLDSIEKASVAKFKDIRPIIVPYLDSLEAKLDALSDIQKTIERFVGKINSFFVHKEILFHIRAGLSIRSQNKDNLEPAMLSSGERHLLLLFSNAITALDRQSIFIIDEPEISLNVKWQRNLIGSLLDCIEDSSVQFVFATHSLEILSQHMERVVKLENMEF